MLTNGNGIAQLCRPTEVHPIGFRVRRVVVRISDEQGLLLLLFVISA